MGFLGDIGKVFHDVVRNPIVQVVFPVAAVANLAAEQVVSKALNRTSFDDPTPRRITAVGSNQSQAPSTINFIQPGGQQGGWGPPPAYSVYFAEPGSMTWDYSTQSIPFSIPLAGRSEVDHYSTSGANSWEDFLETSLANNR